MCAGLELRRIWETSDCWPFCDERGRLKLGDLDIAVVFPRYRDIFLLGMDSYSSCHYRAQRWIATGLRYATCTGPVDLKHLVLYGPKSISRAVFVA